MSGAGSDGETFVVPSGGVRTGVSTGEATSDGDTGTASFNARKTYRALTVPCPSAGDVQAPNTHMHIRLSTAVPLRKFRSERSPRGPLVTLAGQDVLRRRTIPRNLKFLW